VIDVGTERKELSWEVPGSFHGALRVFVVASAADGIGVVEREVQVHGDFVLSTSAPTFLAPGDEATVGVAVTNALASSGKGLPIEVALTTSKGLAVVGASKATLHLDAGKEGTAELRVKANDVLGPASLQITATSSRGKAKSTFELSVRPTQPHRTTIASGAVKGTSKDVPTPRNLYAELRSLDAAFSTLPLALAGALTTALNNNPYGCTEQLISRGIPYVVLATRKELGITRKEAEARVSSTIDELRTRRVPDGGFGIWPADTQASPFHTAYAVHFLTEAAERGFVVPRPLLDEALHKLETYVTGKVDDVDSARVRAWAIYLLTRNGKRLNDAALNLEGDLQRSANQVWQTDLTGIYLAATYALTKQDDKAMAILRSAKLGDVVTPSYEAYYDADVRDALYLYLAARHWPKALAGIPPAPLEAFVQRIGAGHPTTLHAATSILAVEAYASAIEKQGALDGATVIEVVKGGALRPLPMPSVALFSHAPFHDDVTALRFTAGDATTFFAVASSGFDRAPPAAPLREGIEIARELLDEHGKPAGKVQLGEEVVVKVSLRGLKETRSPIAVVDLLPGGFEPLVKEPWHDTELQEDAREVREDRVVVYTWVPMGKRSFSYRMKAIAKGTYRVPPAFVEGLYDPTVQASGTASTIEVVAP
jgi:uncharacterized protein YfaS (alpha-2-macroglobulin family)